MVDVKLAIVIYIGLICCFLGCDWRARTVFLVRAYRRKYGHGKSWNRAHRHYKTNWTFWQRICWIPVFKEKYDNKYRFLAYLTYIHFILTVTTIIAMLVAQFVFDDNKLFVDITWVDRIFSLFRVVHNEATARGTLF